MAGGSWGAAGGYAGSSPTHFDAWCKVKLNYCVPAVASSGNYTITSFYSGAYNIIKIPTSKTNEYFLLENRQFNGYDKALQNGGVKTGGIAVWHIDENISGNENESHKKVDLEEANQGTLGYSQLDTNAGGTYDHYYYSGGKTAFNLSTNPNSKLYDNSDSKASVSVNSTSSNSMSINITLSSGGTGIQSGHTYKLINVNSGKALDVNNNSTADGATVIQWTDNGGTNQQWILTNLSGMNYKLINVNSGKALDVNNNSTADGAAVIQWTDNGGANQQWTFTNISGTIYELINVNSRKALDVNNNSTADGAAVIQWTDNDGNNQRWQLVLIN
jgi:hypothetical protein